MIFSLSQRARPISQTWLQTDIKNIPLNLKNALPAKALTLSNHSTPAEELSPGFPLNETRGLQFPKLRRIPLGSE
jgi:hypothetical protein